jgi:hypothetical protein
MFQRFGLEKKGQRTRGQALGYRYRICEVLVSWGTDVALGRRFEQMYSGGMSKADECHGKRILPMIHWRLWTRGELRSLQLRQAFWALDSLLPRFGIGTWSMICNDSFWCEVAFLFDSRTEQALVAALSLGLLAVRSRNTVGLGVWCAVVSFN